MTRYVEEEIVGPVEMSPQRLFFLSLIGLCFFLIWQAFELRSYIRSDTRPPSWSQAASLELALDYHKAFAKEGAAAVLFHSPGPGFAFSPPLYPAALSKIYGAQDPAAAALWLNFFYMALLALSVFGITFAFRPGAGAVAAAAIFCLSPAVHRLYHARTMDLATVAWVAAGYWALVKSDGFKRWGGCLAFGAVFAVGMLHRASYWAYLIPGIYYWLQALEKPESRVKALAAGVLAAAFLPWYLVHVQDILALPFQPGFALPDWRLVVNSLGQQFWIAGVVSWVIYKWSGGQRPWLVYWMVGWILGDVAVALATNNWQAAVFLRHLLILVDDLGPLFWVLGVIAVIMPQFGAEFKLSWLMLAWMAAAYFFGSLFPDQRYRLFLPGLPALAVAAALSWPKKWIWGLAAVQLVCSINYNGGWLPSLIIPTPIYDPNFMISDPPRAEDWKIPEILREAQKRRDPADPVLNLTVVANDASFNKANFAWQAKLMGEPAVTPRGTDSRISEFSQFVVLKNGGGEPAWDAEALSKAAGAILRKGGWFDRGYQSVATWTLPDRGEAILYQRRALAGPPFGAQTRVAYQYYAHESSRFEGANLGLVFGAWDAARSQYEAMGVSATEAKYRDVALGHFAVEFKNVLAIPAQESAGGTLGEDLRFLKLGALKIKSLGINAEDLRQALQKGLRNWRLTRLELDKTVVFELQAQKIILSGEASVALLDAPRRLELSLIGAKMGASPLPLWLFERVKTLTVSLEPTPERPFAVELPGLTLSRGRLTIP